MDTSSVAVDRWFAKSITDDGAVFYVLEIIHLRVHDILVRVSCPSFSSKCPLQFFF